MTSSSTDPGAFRDLIHDSLNSRMTSCRFEDQQMHYLSSLSMLSADAKGWLEQLCNIDPSFRNISSSQDSFKQEVLQTRFKVFLNSIRSGMSNESMVCVLSANGLTDSALPFDMDTFSSLATDTVSESERVKFVECQFGFFPITFKDGRYARTISTAEQVPIDGSATTDCLSKGTEGTVFAARVASLHHDFEIRDAPDSFIVKRISNLKNAKREINALGLLAERNDVPHPHLARIFSGFQFNAITYLIAERAQQDLENLMKTNTTNTATWLKSQHRGLAEALELIHEGLGNRIILHHDIKPANVLVFGTGDASILKITDWGCASIHAHEQSQSTNQGSLTSKKMGNPPYLPPESRKSNPTSRPHDVWALGCVFLETLIWHVEGAMELQEFRKWRAFGNSFDWCVPGQNELLPIVRTKLRTLKTSTWEVECSVIRKMLRENPAYRKTAAEVVADLE